jgi:preprotein translocase subunit YajC
MFATPAYAQAAGAAGGGSNIWIQILPLVAMVVLFYFLLIRPQQTAAKKHREMVMGVKRGDTVVMSNGMIGKVVRVEDAEVGVEIAQGVTVKVVKSMIADIRSKGTPAAANDVVKS